MARGGALPAGVPLLPLKPQPKLNPDRTPTKRSTAAAKSAERAGGKSSRTPKPQEARAEAAASDPARSSKERVYLARDWWRGLPSRANELNINMPAAAIPPDQPPKLPQPASVPVLVEEVLPYPVTSTSKRPAATARSSGRATRQSDRLATSADRRRVACMQMLTASTSPKPQPLATLRRAAALTRRRREIEAQRASSERNTAARWRDPGAHLPPPRIRRQPPPEEPRTPRCSVCSTPTAESVEHYEAVKLVMAALGMGDEGGGGASSEPLKCFCLGCGDYLGAVAFGTLTQGVRI